MSQDAFARARADVEGRGLRVVADDLGRPWGGFLVLDEAQIDAFTAAYFPDAPSTGATPLPRSPKILVVAPGQRLSWQYHHRRGELWRVLEGPVAVASGPDDVQPEPRAVAVGEQVYLDAGTRHRLIGLDGWGVVAEIWEHTDAAHPSDESDIVRVQDDFGR